MLDAIKLPQPARNPFTWVAVLVLAAIAWIPTVQHSLMMAMHGAIVMRLWPLDMFWMSMIAWTVMMTAMMLPGLAPIASVEYEAIRQQKPGLPAIIHIAFFVIAYLIMWGIFGIPVYLLALLAQQFAQSMPTVGLIVGVAFLVLLGIYQFLPLERRCLGHCNPALGKHTSTHSSPTIPGSIKEGVVHSLYCVGSCGPLMLMMIAVGVMSLPWMIIVTVLIFLEKTWKFGDRLSFAIGIALILFAVVAIFNPAMMPGFYMPQQATPPMHHGM
ncbi:MAG: DUF2182 domain-containing protein [Ktedonobacteraceae bacterium]|nr:DUF2182 domain-containing protein [Ktedonobacteraceae bacterium]